MASKSHFIGEFRGEVAGLLDTVNRVEGLRRQFDALGYGAALQDTDFGEGTGHEDITRQEFLLAAQSYDALYTFLQTDHFTNFYRMVS